MGRIIVGAFKPLWNNDASNFSKYCQEGSLDQYSECNLPIFDIAKPKEMLITGFEFFLGWIPIFSLAVMPWMFSTNFDQLFHKGRGTQTDRLFLLESKTSASC